jgi:cytochrome c biogenesis protein CcmG, thiol:disulfide interchange protein DsbE
MKYSGRQNKRNSNWFQAAVGIGFIILSVTFVLAYFQRHGNEGDVNPNASANQRYAVPVAVKFAAPDLSLENVNEGVESLLGLRGKVVVVNNWATWCPPCKAEMPTLAKFYADHSAEGLTIVAIEAGEPREQVLRFVNMFQLPFTVWLDPDGKALRAFSNQNLPSSYVIDRTGMVRYAWTGEINREMLEKYVAPLLGE